VASPWKTPAFLLLFLPLGTLLGARADAAVEDRDANAVYDPALYQAMEFRSIGPYRGGRVTAVTGVPLEPDTFYMGSTGGGVWKTTNSGLDWANVSDGFFEAASMGALAVSESDPNVVYAGTGSACIRGNVSAGLGVYKSVDAGATWTHVGLRNSGQIGRIRIHPQDPNLVYVAALGHAFGPNQERGVFRSKDAGKSWEKVLYANDTTGAVDLSMDRKNPRILYAALWRGERKPWAIISGGEESGIYKSTDSGDNWTKLGGGLPEGLVGRIGVAVSPANPSRVWALVEAEKGGLFRSEDGGKSFSLVNPDRRFRQRAWYYTHVHAHPKDENTVFVLNTAFYKSTDGGKTFESIPVPHGDNHDLWLNSENPDILINSNDGGANVSRDGGRSWSPQLNQPTAEFYRVTVDDQFLYRVYGAQQDNSTISVPSRTRSPGITMQNWSAMGGGESGHIAVDPRDPNVIYAGSYGGTIDRVDLRTGHTRSIMVYPQMALGNAARDLEFRFQWNAPIRISPHDPNVVYMTSQHVHKTTNQGQSWEVVSPDLTRNDAEKQDFPGQPITNDATGVEVYDVIFAFEESPQQAGVLWAGSDDGLVHLSRDGGRNWTDVSPKGLPEWSTVNTIELSPHAPGRAFIAAYRYRSDDFKPYIFRTDDFGASWTLLTDGKNGIPANHFTRVVREDPDRRGLLYAGTEYGLYVSFDDGAHWQSLQLNLPVTPVTDLAVHRKDLVVATQGRSFWILDDLTPLHQLTDEIASSGAHLYLPRDAYRVEVQGVSGGERASTVSDRLLAAAIPRRWVGSNPPSGAVIYSYFAKKPDGETTIEILDRAGAVVRSEKIDGKVGMNRFAWDLRYPGAKLMEGVVLWGGDADGPKAVPGAYMVKLTSGSWSETRSFQLRKDPDLDVTEADLQDQFDLLVELRDRITETHDALRRIRDVKAQAKAIAERMKDDEVTKAADALSGKLTAVEEKLTQTKSTSRQDPINYPGQLDNQLVYLYGSIEEQDDKPTDSARTRFANLSKELEARLGQLREVVDSDVPAFNDLVKRKGASAIFVSGS
jgi:photosystem II stability/assembly factor-like uncharacterized protein